MSVRKVLDSYAVIAYLNKEPGVDRVIVLFRQARDSGRPLLMSVVNWGEVLYIFHREQGKEVADQVSQILDTLPIEVVDADRAVTRAAAEFKASKKMSYADCFAVALAQSRKAQLVTGDKKFKEVADAISIEWLG